MYAQKDGPTVVWFLEPTMECLQGFHASTLALLSTHFEPLGHPFVYTSVWGENVDGKESPHLSVISNEPRLFLLC